MPGSILVLKGLRDTPVIGRVTASRAFLAWESLCVALICRRVLGALIFCSLFSFLSLAFVYPTRLQLLHQVAMLRLGNFGSLRLLLLQKEVYLAHTALHRLGARQDKRSRLSEKREAGLGVRPRGHTVSHDLLFCT